MSVVKGEVDERNAVLSLAGFLCLFLAFVFANPLSALDSSHLLFYLPFEDSLDASLARGDGKCLTTEKPIFEKGVIGSS